MICNTKILLSKFFSTKIVYTSVSGNLAAANLCPYLG